MFAGDAQEGVRAFRIGHHAGKRQRADHRADGDDGFFIASLAAGVRDLGDKRLDVFRHHAARLHIGTARIAGQCRDGTAGFAPVAVGTAQIAFHHLCEAALFFRCSGARMGFARQQGVFQRRHQKIGA